MAGHAVVIAGGGPTGLMLAGELALAGIDVAIVERRVTHDVVGSRAAGLHSRTIEVFDQRGIADRFLSRGMTWQAVHFSAIFLDISDFPTRHPYVLGLLQRHTERILADWVAELGVPLYRSREVTGFAQDSSGVDVELSDGETLRAAYLIGCDGGRSLVRKCAGIDFPGWEPSVSYLVADAELTEAAPWGMTRHTAGIVGVMKFEEGPSRILVAEPEMGRTGEPTIEDVRAGLLAACGTDFGIHDAQWISRFTDATRQAAQYRDRRVFLAGDSAHVHFPYGGQGLNTGVQDAVNLGWKLAQVIKGLTPDSLLDTYHLERHPVAARVLHNTMAQTPLAAPGVRIDALRDIMSELLAMEEPRTRIAAMMSGLDIHYDLGDGHPLVGRRMPDLDIVTSAGEQRVFHLLRQGQPVLLNFGAPLDIGPWLGRIPRVDAKYLGKWELPVIGGVDAPDAVLVRPDGYVAWVGDGTHAGLYEALTAWFGRPERA